jgi:hypothetical protein
MAGGMTTLQRDSHWVGLLFKKQFRVSSASCLLSKNPQTQSAQDFNGTSSISQRNAIFFVQRE